MIDTEGITIDGVHTSEFGLELVSMTIPLPDVVENKINVLGMSGSIDLTEIYGYRTYNDRKGLKFVFTLNGSYDDLALQQQKLAAMVHGKKCKIIVDNDINYYYMARLEVEIVKDNNVFSNITLQGTAEPFKYEKYANNEDIEWNDVDFETTIFRDNIIDVSVNGETTVTITAGQQPVTPKILAVVIDELQVYYDGVYYDLDTGIHIIPQIKIADEDVDLKFKGKGKVSIEYRGAYL